jgi:AcrR family transcriptional regulator
VSIIPGPKLMKAATKLLAERGPEGTSTRAICEAAGVTQPTLYHHFGDKGGLIEAVVTEGFERALAGKKAKERETDDPVDDLRRGWDDHVSFGVANPHFYAVMHGRPGLGRLPKAAEEAGSMLRSLTKRIARTGRLRVEQELAAQAVWAAVYGVTSMLSSMPDFGWHEALNVTVREGRDLRHRSPRAGGQSGGCSRELRGGERRGAAAARRPGDER